MNMSETKDKKGEASSDSEDFYSADEDINENSTSRQRSSRETKSSDRIKEGQPEQDSLIKEDVQKRDSAVTTDKPPAFIKVTEENRPVPPPRRRRKKEFHKQASLEEPIAHDLVGDDIRRANTFSWPRSERPAVRGLQCGEEEKEEEGEGDSSSGIKLTESADSTPVHRPVPLKSKSDSMLPEESKEMGEEHPVSRKHNHPSISIEPNTSLELTEDLLKESEVESDDIIMSRAMGSNNTGEGMIYVHSEDEESIDGDQLLTDSADVARQKTGHSEEEEEEEEEEGEEEEHTDGGGAKKTSATPPSDSQILAHTFIKNLDTGEEFPLILAEKRIPTGNNNPVDSYCKQREKGLSDSWDGGINEDNNGDSEGATVVHKKPRKKRFVKFFAKGKDKKKGEVRKGEVASGSDDENISEQDHHTVKYKPASHNKGKLEFENIRLKQELNRTVGNESRAIWVIEFSICGRLLATAGQDSVVRVWVLRTAYHFFHELQVKYAKFGVSSSADSLSERSSVNSSMSSDPDEDPSSLKPFLEQPLCTYTGHSADVLDLSWSKNFFLLSSSMDKTVRLWHISRKECLCCFQHVDFVTAVAFHPRDDRYFLSGSLDGKLRLWNIPDKKVALWNEIEGVGSHLITAANFCMNGKLAVAGTYDGRCIFYETEHLKYHTQIHVKSRHGKNRGRKISGIEPLPGEDKILVTSNDSRLRLYNLKDHSLTCKYKGCLNSGSQIRATFSREGEYIICGSEDNYIYIWKTHHDFNKLSSARRDRNDYYESFTAHSAPVTAVAFAPVPGITVDEGLRDIGEVVVAGDYKGNVKIYVNSEVL